MELVKGCLGTGKYYDMEGNEVKTRRLTCSCCGEPTQGRQWYNRDAGFGVCVPCSEMIEKKETREYMHECYGVKGVHYSIEQ